MANKQIGRPRQGSSEETRANLITIAAAHLSQSGYARTTFRAIARDAGLTIGAVYYYFPTKVSLIEAIVEEVNRSILPVFDSIFEKDTLADRVECMLVAVSVTTPHVLGGVGNFLLIDAPRYKELQPIYDRWVASHEDVLARMARDAVLSGDIAPDTDQRGLVDVLRALLYGVSALFSSSPDRVRAAGQVTGRILESGRVAKGPARRKS